MSTALKAVVCLRLISFRINKYFVFHLDHTGWLVWWRQKIATRHHFLPCLLFQIVFGALGNAATCHACFGILLQALSSLDLCNLSGR
jgi:hypothetical protein